MAVELRRLFPSCATTLRRARALHALLLLSGRLVAYPPSPPPSSPLLPPRRPPLLPPLLPPPPPFLLHHHHCLLNSLISAFVSHRRPSSALSAFHRLLSHPALRPDAFTFPVVLKACGDPQHGEKIHSLALKMGFCSNVYVGASLLHMYSRFGLLGRARIVFDEMPERDLGAWNALLSGFCQNSRAADAVGVFEEMVVERVGGDKVTFASVVPIIALLEDQLLGRQCMFELLSSDWIRIFSSRML
uniref:Pentatricopeptide repeat-containing protein n=1 Tax=Ananas comosus var. bracteatus TaxID=296719 RepID=A0A6V7NVC9_ANACO|nr:unnamed protein product [Ananas comosus var. bracteatus]